MESFFVGTPNCPSSYFPLHFSGLYHLSTLLREWLLSGMPHFLRSEGRGGSVITKPSMGEREAIAHLRLFS